MGQALAQVRSLREELQSKSGGSGGQQQSAVEQLSRLRSQVGRDDRQLTGFLNDAMGAMRRIQSQDGLLDARLNNNAVVSLERLEVELARRASQQSGARTGAPEDVPQNYKDAVATYFKALSK